MDKSAYQGNKLLKKIDTPISYTQDELKEYVKCARDSMYFIKNYVKIINVDEGLVSFNPYPYQEEIITKSINNRFVICKMPRQCGKALTLDTPILTPTGFKNMGDLTVGDTIFGPDGQQTRIKFITDTMFNHDVFEVTFDNGDVIKADKDHLWTVNSTNWTAGSRDLTTEQLRSYINDTNKPYIDFTAPIDLPEKNLLVDPYQLGVWLGDGASNSATITCHKDDLVFYKAKMNVGRVWFDSRNSNVAYFTLPVGQKNIRELGVLGNKHIPTDYLVASIDQRLELLRGLMDTDGSVNQRGSCEFYQKDEALINQVRTLLASLGVKSRKRYRTFRGVNYWTVSFNTTLTVFNLARKNSKHKCTSHPKNKRLYIKSIKPISSEPVRCLQVDNTSHLFLCGTTLVPTHNTTAVVGLLLWYVLFNQEFSIAILAHKLSQAQEILARIQLAYEHLPKWLQQGIKEWNKRNIELENNSKIIASATTAAGARGGSYNMLYLDEFAFVPNNMQEKFFSSTYPTISSGKTTKVLITSTPNGLNMFFKLWRDSELGRNDYERVSIHWSDTPGRDQNWKELQIRNTSAEQFRVEFECEFVGSSNTLIDPSILRMLMSEEPLSFHNNIKIYKEVEEGCTYAITVDTARGLGQDYSVFVVYNITRIPYEVVCIYRANDVIPMTFPNIIISAAKKYNNAYVLVETNDIGQQICDIIHYDLEYDNLLTTSRDEKSNIQVLTAGFSQQTKLGIRTTQQTKKLGCSNLKTLVESQKLILNDETIIFELMRFVAVKNSFEAEDGNDDTVACCWLFAWMTQQSYFKELTNLDIRKAIVDQKQKDLEDDVLPFFISTNDNILNFSDVVVSVKDDRWLAKWDD